MDCCTEIQLISDYIETKGLIKNFFSQGVLKNYPHPTYLKKSGKKWDQDYVEVKKNPLWSLKLLLNLALYVWKVLCRWAVDVK